MSDWLRPAKASAALLIVGLLAACQPAPGVESTRPADGFTARQRQVLEREGFVREGDSYELGLENRVLFDFDRSELKADTRDMLGRLGKVLSGAGIRGAGIEGHADAEGAQAYNLQLSRRRAEAVKTALAATGMDPQRMRSWGVGENDPIASNSTRQGRRENRRVVIVVTPGDAARGR